MNKGIVVVGKAVGYVTIVATALLVLFRGILGVLLGAHSDLALLAIPVVAVLGLIAILWVASKLLKDLQNTINSQKED